MARRKVEVKMAEDVAAHLPPSYVKTHDTSGLPGYPAIDVFAPPHAPAIAHFWGRVVRTSGRPISAGGVPGGPYGLSVYIRNTVTGVTRYCTHMERLNVQVGTAVKPGRVIGYVADSAVSGKPGTSHVHLGTNRP